MSKKRGIAAESHLFHSLRQQGLSVVKLDDMPRTTYGGTVIAGLQKPYDANVFYTQGRAASLEVKSVSGYSYQYISYAGLQFAAEQPARRDVLMTLFGFGWGEYEETINQTGLKLHQRRGLFLGWHYGRRLPLLALQFGQRIGAKQNPKRLWLLPFFKYVLHEYKCLTVGGTTTMVATPDATNRRVIKDNGLALSESFPSFELEWSDSLWKIPVTHPLYQPLGLERLQQSATQRRPYLGQFLGTTRPTLLIKREAESLGIT